MSNEFVKKALKDAETQKHQINKKMVIMGGLPGSGKSTVAKKNNNFGTEFKIDCDEFKKSIPGYDPNNVTNEVHEASKVMEKEALDKALRENVSFLYDTTATNAQRIVKLIKDAQNAGFKVVMVYVKVSLETSLKRNAARERHVPEAVIYEKADEIEVAMHIYNDYVDDFIVIEND
jgi:predicted kinase